jgi:hypothetical protein
MGGLERIAFFTPTTASSRWRLRRWTARWRQRRGEWSQLPKAEVVLAVSLVLYGRWLLHRLYTTETDQYIQSVAVHAVLGGGWPR